MWVKSYLRPRFFPISVPYIAVRFFKKRPPKGIYPPGSRRASSPGLMLYWLGCPFWCGSCGLICHGSVTIFALTSQWTWTQHVWRVKAKANFEIVEVDHQSIINQPNGFQSSIINQVIPGLLRSQKTILVKQCHKPHKPSIWTDGLYNRP